MTITGFAESTATATKKVKRGTYKAKVTREVNGRRVTKTGKATVRTTGTATETRAATRTE